MIWELTHRQLSILVLLLIISLLLYSCGSATAQGDDRWLYLSQAKIPGLQSQLQKQYADRAVPINVGRMRVLRIRQKNQPQMLYLVDTRVALEPNRRRLNPTCGAAGCEIEGYLQSGKNYREVLSVYLDPIPPKGKSLIEPAASNQNGLPCLNFNQRKIQTGRIEVIQWCYNGQRYQFVSSSLRQP